MDAIGRSFLALLLMSIVAVGCSGATSPAATRSPIPSTQTSGQPTLAPSRSPSPAVASPTSVASTSPTSATTSASPSLPTITPPPTGTPLPSLAPSLTPSSASPSPIATALPTIDATWQQVAGPPLDRLHEAYATAWTGSGFVLAGIVERVVPDHSEGIAFWTSPDGRTWTMGDERSAGWVNDFAFDESGAGVAIGFLGSSAAAWSSPDGLRWTKVLDQPAFVPRSSETELRIQHVAHGDADYVAIGYSMPHPLKAVVLVSTDGAAWTRLPSNPAFSGVSLDGIAAVGDRYVLVGHTRWPFRAIFWTSADGRTWSEMSAPPDTDPTDQSAGTYQVVAGPAGWLLTRSGSEQAQRAWWSADGTTWTRAATPPGAYLSAPYEEPTVAAPSGFVADAWSDACASGLWTSDDAVEWDCVAGFSAESQPNRTMAASDVTIVTGDPAGTVWVAELGE